MTWFKKEERETGLLPELPSIPQEHYEASQDQERTSIPSPPVQRVMPPIPQHLEEQQKDDIEDMPPIAPPQRPLPYQQVPPAKLGYSRAGGYVSPQVKKYAEPVYIRIDKFQTTVEAFQEIKQKLEEIEGYLEKTRELKKREEDELMEWEREVEVMKTRIEAIDRNIFDKLD